MCIAGKVAQKTTVPLGAESLGFGYWLLFGTKMKTRAAKYFGENKMGGKKATDLL